MYWILREGIPVFYVFYAGTDGGALRFCSDAREPYGHAGRGLYGRTKWRLRCLSSSANRIAVLTKDKCE